MIESFSDIVSKMKYHLKHKEEGYAIPMAPKYNKAIGNILPMQYTVVTGLQSSGKTSFVDQNYVLSVLLQRRDMEEKPPLKIFYFSLKDTALKKFQALLCGYIKLVHNGRIDIPTLNSQPGRLLNLESEPKILATIDEAEIFFNEVIDEEVLQVVTGVTKPSAICQVVSDYLTSIEDVEEKPLVMMIVDSTDFLSSESDNFRTIQGAELDYKFDTGVTDLVKEGNVHAVIITPAHGANSRFPKENEPNYRQLGVYGRTCDKGIVLYNPIAEGNANYLRCITDSNNYITNEGLNTLRFWHVVRNTDGIDSISNRLLFIPGTSFMLEMDMIYNIDSLQTVKDMLFNTAYNPFYKEPPSIDDAAQ